MTTLIDYALMAGASYISNRDDTLNGSGGSDLINAGGGTNIINALQGGNDFAGEAANDAAWRLAA